jgi:sugar O-acyltransferase (sialic acid O-acetyltransferase NeuD family)
MNKPVIILGSGGHAAVLADMLQQVNRPIAAIVSPDRNPSNAVFKDIKHLYNDDDILEYAPGDVELVNGIGSVPIGMRSEPLRVKLYRYFKSHGYHFSRVVSPHAIISPYATLAEGAQVMANSVIQTDASIGENTIINTAAVIEHDCSIGAHNHIAPGVIISGDVSTEEQVHIGTGASVVHGIRIAKLSIVGAGAVITKDIPAETIVYPAKVFVKGRTA